VLRAGMSGDAVCLLQSGAPQSLKARWFTHPVCSSSWHSSLIRDSIGAEPLTEWQKVARLPAGKLPRSRRVDAKNI
jgi:hypothetical protein